MSDLMDRLKARWTAQNIQRGPAVSPEDLAAFEARHNVIFPPDLRAYFAEVGGMDGDSGGDNEMYRFLPFREVEPLPDHYGDQASPTSVRRLFILVDYFISAFHYVIRLSADPSADCPVFRLDGYEGPIAAPSWSAFLEQYLIDPNGFLVLRDDADGTTCPGPDNLE